MLGKPALDQGRAIGTVMVPEDEFDSRTVGEAKKTASSSSPAVTASSIPRTFFLKTEREMEANIQRGRKSSRSSVAATDTKDVPDDQRQFGVQSLEETLSPLSPVDSASGTDSISTDQSSGANSPAKRKRKAGNRVHPSIR